MKTVPGRRHFLKTLAAAGAGICVTPFAGAAQNRRPLTVVLSQGVRSPEFLSGIGRRSSLEVTSISVFQAQPWVQWVRKHRGHRLIGLMDNASYVVFEAVLGDQGARFLVTGHHAQAHRFITLPETAGVAATLEDYLSTSGSGYQLAEICHGEPKSTLAEPAANTHQGKSDWASVIGDCYAQIANGDWCAGLPGTFSRSGSNSVAAQDALVSFVVKV